MWPVKESKDAIKNTGLTKMNFVDDPLWYLSAVTMGSGDPWIRTSSNRREPVRSMAESTYLLPKSMQRNRFLWNGYIEGTPGDYGLVKRAVGNRNIPIYQTAKDAIDRKDLVVIGNRNNSSGFSPNAKLQHAGSYPSAIYVDGSGKLYQKSWDLNDYGGDDGAAGHYNWWEKLAVNALDKIGSPTVITTGYQPMVNFNDDSHMTLTDHYDDDQLNRIVDQFLKQNNLHIDSYSNVDPIISETGNSYYPAGANITKFLSLPEVIVTGKRKLNPRKNRK